ncbi:MAG: phosphoribosylformylglycinamidine synthase subunit PurS [Thermaerobacter sp.]|nr:phosphoribosylformylglycinamidine synthase subunit PurS [Thermaerobacter sp.]
MRYRIAVEVMLKPAILDPAGQATEGILQQMGFSAEDVRIGKRITVETEADSAAAAEIAGRQMAEKLLANPVMEDFSVSVVAL